ncbi:NRF1 factor, partial [Copsychus sechellarum]|nr:NRF1 factor [Copsychus sechellarum]
GPVGMAAAAAVATGKKRKRPHVFESNPSIRKRQQTRLLRKLRATLDEYTTRVGQQAIVLCISPSKPNPVFKVFGAAPLENVVGVPKKERKEFPQFSAVTHLLAPTGWKLNTRTIQCHKIPKHLPTFSLLQAQLRAFIPEMLKYSTGRGKPGWGKESCKPIWWPEDIPWANVRSDVRTEEQKQRVGVSLPASKPSTGGCRMILGSVLWTFPAVTCIIFSPPQVGTGATVATLADASELPTTVTVAQVNYSAVADGEVRAWSLSAHSKLRVNTEQGQKFLLLLFFIQDFLYRKWFEFYLFYIYIIYLFIIEAAAHAVATLAEATLQGGGQIVLSGETAAAVGALTGVQDANGLVQIPVSMYQTVVTSLAQGNGPVQVAMAPVATRIADTAVTMDGQAVEVVTLDQ